MESTARKTTADERLSPASVFSRPVSDAWPVFTGLHADVGPYRALPASRGFFGSLVHRVIVRTRASPWTSLAGRVALFAFALLVLAWIGRAATAATTTPPAFRNDALAAVDAGTTVTVPGSIVPPPPPVIALPAALPAAARGTPASARATVDDPVYINHASAEELRRLPGVGPKRAEGIIALRHRVGRFQRVEDLLRVKGIGRATIRKWRALLRLDAPPSASADAGPPL